MLLQVLHTFDYSGLVMGRSLARVVSLVALALLVNACNGGSPTLQLSTGAITEDAFRIQIRQTALTQPPSFDILCPLLNDVPVGEVLDRFARVSLFAAQTPVAQADPEDELRAAEILREECESLT